MNLCKLLIKPGDKIRIIPHEKVSRDLTDLEGDLAWPLYAQSYGLFISIPIELNETKDYNRVYTVTAVDGNKISTEEGEDCYFHPATSAIWQRINHVSSTKAVEILRRGDLVKVYRRTIDRVVWPNANGLIFPSRTIVLPITVDQNEYNGYVLDRMCPFITVTGFILGHQPVISNGLHFGFDPILWQKAIDEFGETNKKTISDFIRVGTKVCFATREDYTEVLVPHDFDASLYPEIRTLHNRDSDKIICAVNHTTPNLVKYVYADAPFDGYQGQIDYKYWMNTPAPEPFREYTNYEKAVLEKFDVGVDPIHDRFNLVIGEIRNLYGSRSTYSLAFQSHIPLHIDLVDKLREHDLVDGVESVPSRAFSGIQFRNGVGYTIYFKMHTTIEQIEKFKDFIRNIVFLNRAITSYKKYGGRRVG